MVESTASSVQYETIQVAPLLGALGTEIQGVDLTRPLNDRAVAEIRHAWLAYQLVVFRDQDITPQQQRDFAERFGELDTWNQRDKKQRFQQEGDPRSDVLVGLGRKLAPLGTGCFETAEAMTKRVVAKHGLWQACVGRAVELRMKLVRVAAYDAHLRLRYSPRLGFPRR